MCACTKLIPASASHYHCVPPPLPPSWVPPPLPPLVPLPPSHLQLAENSSVQALVASNPEMSNVAATGVLLWTAISRCVGAAQHGCRGVAWTDLGAAGTGGDAASGDSFQVRLAALFV